MSHSLRTVVALSLPLVPTLAVASPAAAQDYRPAAPLATNITPSGSYFHRDLNGNGREDSIIADNGYGLCVLFDPDLTMPSGSFTVAYSSSFGFFNGVDLADMNNDGTVDFVFQEASIFAPASLRYVPNNGGGTFGQPVTIAAGSVKVIYDTVGDFNGDGQTDAAVVDLTANPVLSVMLQNNGTFTTAHTVQIPGLDGIEAGDFNGDGADDLAWYDAGTLSILAGTSGTFGSPTTRSIPVELNNGFVRDLDHDGMDDLVLQEASFNGWRMDAFFGDATNFLTAPVSVVPAATQERCDYLGPFDVDGDGNDDLLCVLRNKPGYRLIRTDGARGFSPSPLATTMSGGLIDLDADGDLDLIMPLGSGGYDRQENIASYGVGCSGANGTPRLDVGAAIPGNSAFAVTLSGAAATAPAALLLSLTSTFTPTCGLQIDPNQPFEASFGTTDPTGGLNTPIPLAPGLPRGTVHLQAIVLDAQGSLNFHGVTLGASGGRTVSIW